MDCYDCNDSAPSSSTDVNAVLISMDENNKSDSLSNEILCNNEADALSEKAIPGDLSGLDNLEILHDYKDNVFSRFSNSNTMMDCLSDINQSPVPFDIPSMDNDDTGLPVYGPFAQFESPPTYETDILDDSSVPGICGLHNLGNTCFMNAGLQCLFNNKIFKEYFVETNLENFGNGALTLKFAEMMKKVWSGTYSTIHIGEFKDCFGDMYNQFRNFRQHDCQEFLALLLDTMHEELNNSNKGKVRNKADITFSNVNNCRGLSNSIPSEKLEYEVDGKNPSPKETLPNNELQCGSSETSSKMDVVPDANNTKLISNTIGTVKKEIPVEVNSTLYESNTEKMADLLINNNKLGKILNKNEIGTCKKETAHFGNVSIKDVEKNEGLSLPLNLMEKNELVSKLKVVNKIPSIDDFVKDNKTWNTNVLVSEETNNLFKFDSEKFPKHESNRLQETVDNLGQIVDLGPKQGGLKRVKITNIIHEKHKMMEKSTEQFASCTVMHKRLKIENMDANLESPCEQDDTVEMEPVPGDEYSEGSSQSSELYPLNSDCRELLVAEEIRRAYSSWDHYKSLNQSVIVDTFHGQFRSSVVCNQCSHHSITYEPFMYLPVFLPHTLERQIILTFVQNDGSSPVRFLLNVNKYDRILKIREALIKLLDYPTEEVILAEVFENHISRFLDENQSIRRINDSTRSIYAFEVGKSCETNTDLPKSSNSGAQELPEALNLTEDDGIFKTGPASLGLFESSTSESRQDTDLSQNCDSFKTSTLPDLQKNESVDLSFSAPTLPDTSYLMLMGDEMPAPAGPVQFHTCAICLEELPSYTLSLHRNCECILCSTCIEVSCKHYGGVTFICPICSVSVSPAEDFVSLSKIQDYELKISTIPIPIVFRHDTFHEGVLKEKVLIGHPGLLKLPSSIPASKLYECVDKAIPFLSTYSLLLVDGQGMNCARCMYNKRCSGCEISRIGDVKLTKNDSIAVRYVELLPENIASAAYVVEHKSMQQTRHKTELDIYDCLDFFSERESLDEDSPWYCPVCRQNQQATKSLSVWKFPEVLIIYLKRFVFHNFVSIKVEDKVAYPLEGLDLSSFSSGPFSDELVYDLQACVCHFGGVNAGHYTSYSKHADTNEWYYYNDENVKKEAPKTDDCVNEYIFFYQKR